MSKDGKHSITSSRHAREGWKQWRADQGKAQAKSKMVRIWVPKETLWEGSPFTSAEENMVSQPDEFKSFVSLLREHPGDSWGYLVAPRIISGESRPPAPANMIGRPSSRPPGRVLYVGDPDIDVGAGKLIPLPPGNTAVAIQSLDEKDDPYSTLLNDAGKILATYDYLRPGSIPTKDVRKPQAAGAADNLRRKTIDVSPGISRAIQLMIESGKVDEARKILADVQQTLALEMEAVFPASKVVACGWHCNSGMPEKPGILHLDVWLHSTEPQIVNLGKKKKDTLLRTWTAGGLDHGGPGPGICAWDRHMAALGEEMEILAPARCWEVRNAIKLQEDRAMERRRPGTANRDVTLHRKFDALVAAALPTEFVEQGMAAYRVHLRKVYAEGDRKLNATVADPVKFARKRDKLAKSMRVVRSREKSLSDSEKELSTRQLGMLDAARDLAKRERRKWIGKRWMLRGMDRDLTRRQAQTALREDGIENRLAAIGLQESSLKLQVDDAGKITNDLRRQKTETKRIQDEAEFVRDTANNLLVDATKAREAAAVQGILDARRLVLGEGISPPNAITGPEIARKFQQELEEVQKRSIFEGMVGVFKAVFPNRISKATTSTELARELTATIRRTISEGFQTVIGLLVPKRRMVATELDGMKDELVAVAGEYRQSATLDGLNQARCELLGAEAGDAPATEEEMRSAIGDAILQKFKDAETSAKSVVAPIPIAQLAEMLGFSDVPGEGFLIAEIENGYGKIPHRLALDGETFELWSLNLGNAGGTWEIGGKGQGALDLMKAIDKKLSRSSVCERLAELFPDRWAGILLEMVAKKNPQLWRGLAAGVQREGPPQDMKR